MKISTKGRYALRIMIDLAENANGEYIRLKDISARQGITLKYMEQIMPIACLDDVPNRCDRQDQCSTLEFWEGLKKVIDQYVDGVTLADLVKNHEEKCEKLDL